MAIHLTPTQIPDLCIFEPQLFRDERGSFCETFNQRQFEQITTSTLHFVQDNHSSSVYNVLRGLHYQIQHPQGKLVRVVEGSIYDVAIDLRQHSPTFGQWVDCILSAENQRQFWIPPGFAHGFLSLSERAEVIYKVTDYYYPEYERCILWNDPDLKISWPLNQPPKLSPKDQAGSFFSEAIYYD